MMKSKSIVLMGAALFLAAEVNALAAGMTVGLRGGMQLSKNNSGSIALMDQVTIATDTSVIATSNPAFGASFTYGMAPVDLRFTFDYLSGGGGNGVVSLSGTPNANVTSKITSMSPGLDVLYPVIPGGKGGFGLSLGGGLVFHSAKLNQAYVVTAAGTGNGYSNATLDCSGSGIGGRIVASGTYDVSSSIGVAFEAGYQFAKISEFKANSAYSLDGGTTSIASGAVVKKVNAAGSAYDGAAINVDLTAPVLGLSLYHRF